MEFHCPFLFFNIDRNFANEIGSMSNSK